LEGGGGVADEVFEAEFVAVLRANGSAVIEGETDLPVPPEGSGGDGVFLPEVEAAGGAGGLGPGKHGEHNIAAIADEVNEFSGGPELVEEREVAEGCAGSFVADEGFVSLGAEVVEDAGDEFLVGDFGLFVEDALEVSAGHIKKVKAVVVGEEVDELGSDAAFFTDPGFFLVEGGDPVGFVDDGEFGVGVEDALEEGGAGAGAADDEEERVGGGHEKLIPGIEGGYGLGSKIYSLPPHFTGVRLRRSRLAFRRMRATRRQPRG